MVTFLILLSIVLAVLAGVQLVRVFEASAKLRGDASIVPTDVENKYQSRMMLAFMFAYFSFFIWLVARYGGHLLPVAASDHGEHLDMIMDFNLVIITIVFAITHFFLFYYAFKYVFNKDRKAFYYTHSNKLEMLWTIVPSIFLAIIIFFGLQAWLNITDEAPDSTITIELYPKQFDWTARYAGNDSILGTANYNMISGTNPLGVITETSIAQKSAELTEEIASIKEELETTPSGGVKEEQLLETLAKRERQLVRVQGYASLDIADLEGGNDDVLMKGEFYIPKGRDVNFIFRSQDVIHSAFMPHFRAQMNCVPGMTTNFHFVPNKTTEQMREITGKDNFDFILLCNKICGAAHYNMQMTIKVVEQEEFDSWLASQKTFAQSIAPADEEGTAMNAGVEGNEITMIEQ